MENDAPILILDTGVGGLTVLEEVQRALPDAPLIFAADRAGLPYGTKTEAEVAARVAGLLGRMSERYQPRLACIACNTASTIALGMVREVLEIPIVGTVPAIKPAATMTKTGVIGLLGTAGTVRQPYVDRLEADFASDKRLIRHPAPGLVDLAEAKAAGEPISVDDVKQEVSGLLDAPDANEIDTIVLACTHFPLLEAELAQIFGPNVNYVHGAKGIARRIAFLTEDQTFERSQKDFAVVTGKHNPAQMERLSRQFSPYGLDEVRVF
ncbi:glutamate racemase [Erythrobacter sp. YT30]|uniref:glutamate racemase n=1 Tax=Erythrobacter sp. YT30 TaxID=1735012 RepID=UPI00076D49C7|nr:glutamate racemase [Erythrobacter sp. YT30]KWV92750.1 glutamate racemase [Erythrobacter sp. YT30]